MTDNSLINSVTEKLGINKLALATLLGVNNSVFTRIVAGTRQLPLKATAAMAWAHVIITKLPLVAAPQPTQEALNNYQQQATWCLARLQPLQKQLLQMQTHYQQANNMQAFLKSYAGIYPPTTPKQQRWLDEQTYQAQQKIQKNGWDAQQQVLLKMALLRAEAAFYTTHGQDVFAENK